MTNGKEKKIVALGTVTEALPNATFRVILEDGPPRLSPRSDQVGAGGEAGKEILAHLAGKMRIYRIKVFVGNKVRVELSQYGEDKGRIIQRL